jgi:LPXTG-motif cell wall-anchored protein
MFLQLAEGENDGNYSALAETGGVMDAYVFIPSGFLPEFDKDTYVRADYFDKYDPVTAEALLNALMSQQTVGLSIIGTAAIAGAGIKIAKAIIEKRKAAVAAGTKKPLFGAGGLLKGKAGGLLDKLKGAATGGDMEQKSMDLKDQPIGGSVQFPGGQFQANYTPNATGELAPTFFQKNKTLLLIGGAVLVAGGIFLAVRKKK